MKPPKPDLQNTRILRFAARFCALPYDFARAVCAGIGRLWQRGKSGERLRPKTSCDNPGPAASFAGCRRTTCIEV